MRIATVYAVFADEAEARRVGRAMVEERLAACVNILGPITSIYRWQGDIAEASEVAALFKTSGAAADTLIARIAELHSYDAPCIEEWPSGAVFGPYSVWVEDNVGDSSKPTG